MTSVKIENEGRAGGSRSLEIRAHSCRPVVVFDLANVGGGAPNSPITDLTYDEAREIIALLQAAVPEEEEKTLFETQWPEVPVGARFGFSVNPVNPFYPYVKQSETTFEWESTSEARSISDLTPGDRARGIHWKTVQTMQEQINALPPGAKFDTIWNGPYMKLAEDKVWAAKVCEIRTVGEGYLTDWVTSTEEISVREEEEEDY